MPNDDVDEKERLLNVELTAWNIITLLSVIDSVPSGVSSNKDVEEVKKKIRDALYS